MSECGESEIREYVMYFACTFATPMIIMSCQLFFYFSRSHLYTAWKECIHKIHTFFVYKQVCMETVMLFNMGPMELNPLFNSQSV